MWPINLSVRLPIADLVGRYLTNYLIGREPIFQRITPLVAIGCPNATSCGISDRFQSLSPSERQVTHVLLTRPPLTEAKQASLLSVRLACVRRAASVRPEPGSNSLFIVLNAFRRFNLLQSVDPASCYFCWFRFRVCTFTLPCECTQKIFKGFYFVSCDCSPETL